LAESQSSETSARTAQVRRRREASSGKMEATRVRRLSSSVDAFESVGSAQAALVGGGQLEDGESSGAR